MKCLETSGLLINPDNPADAADAVSALCGERDWRANRARMAIANVARWNEHARQDQAHVSAFLENMLTWPRLGDATTIDPCANVRQL